MPTTPSISIRRIRRVRDFLSAHPEWNVSAAFLALVAQLDEVIVGLSRLLQEQEAVDRMGQGDTQRQRALREHLWQKHMLPLAGLAREAFGIPGVAVELRMPKKTADNDRVLKSAGAMADAAEKQKDVFIGLGAPADFIDRFRSATQALADALGARVENNRRRGEATAEIRKQSARGRRVIRVINHILRPQLQDDEKLMAAWETAKAPTDPGGVRAMTPEVPAPDIAKVA